MRLRDSLGKRIARCPAAKAFFYCLAPVLSGVLAAILIAQLTTSKGIIGWEKIYAAWSFWVLVGILVLVYSYARMLYLVESSTSNFQDPDWMDAYLAGELLPPLVAGACQELKKNGREAFMEYTEAILVLKKGLKKK